MAQPSKTDVIILCGGLGKRLKAIVADRPKAMALVAGYPFLDILLSFVGGFGFRRFILCIGHKGDFIKRYYRDKAKVHIVISEEKIPLGTGGALKNAAGLIKSRNFLVLNGDSMIKADLRKFLNFHLENNALISIMLKKIAKPGGYGVVGLSKSRQITEFRENARPLSLSFINAGVYLFQKEALSFLPWAKAFSLEEDFFPGVAKKGKIYGYVSSGRMVDIGTPEKYAQAKYLLTRSKCTF